MRNVQRLMLSALAAGMLSAFLGGAAAAQDEGPTSFIGERTIDQLADAYVAIGKIQAQANADLQQAGDQARAQQVIEAAQGAMIRAVERTGLELREFNRLAELAALDPALNARILARVREREPI